MILRRRLLAAIGGLAVLAPLKSAVPQKAAAPNPGNGSMEIKHIGSQPAGKGPADYFTGAVRIDPPLPSARAGAHCGCQCHIRARRTHSLAYSPTWANANRHCRRRVGSTLGRYGRGNPAWRCCLVPTRREALAWRDTRHGDDSHCHSRAPRRQGSWIGWSM
jgi:hypothetical protein